MTIDDAALVRLDELLRDFVSNNRALFGSPRSRPQRL
jgi:hypothetical protein